MQCPENKPLTDTPHRLAIAVCGQDSCSPVPFFRALTDAGMLAAANRAVLEIHWVAPQEMARQLIDKPPNLQFHPCDSDTPVFQRWGIGIAASNADYVAVLDIACPPGPSWWSTLRQALDDNPAVVYGAVECVSGPQDPAMIAYLAEYAQFYPPLRDEQQEVPGINIVLRQTLLPDREQLRTTGFIKIFVLWELAAKRQVTPQAIENMPVHYNKPFSLRAYLRYRYRHGRHFAAGRHNNPGQPPRWLCILGSPALPLIRVSRIWRIVRHQPALRPGFIRFLLLLLVEESAWSIGEFAGYLRGQR